MKSRREAVKFLRDKPYKYARLVGFSLLTELHNDWIREMVLGKEDHTLQAHRGSYKTTCVSVALALIIILHPNDRTIFLRKTDDDVKEVIRQVRNILMHPATQYLVQCIYGVNLRLVIDNAMEILTNLTTGINGTPQLVGAGIGGSLTGQHYDRVFTDDIVTLTDRISKAERDRTKQMYQELQNIKNRGGRIFNSGTPWHKDDCFALMPNIERHDCYETGLISDEDLKSLRAGMLASLFAANYELRHIAAEDVIFTTPKTGAEDTLIEQGEQHIDAAYGGEDYTAYTAIRKTPDAIYVLGKLWHKHIDDCIEDISKISERYNLGRMYVENNGDKGYLGKDLRNRGFRVSIYHENMNKFIKITTYIKPVWQKVVFVTGTDPEYINMICDFNDRAEHDDAPDSLASAIREAKGVKAQAGTVWMR